MMKLTEPRKHVLQKLRSRGGRASPYDLAYPRAHMMHLLQRGGLIAVEGSTNAWGEPTDGVYVLTDAGRTALLEEKADA
ncbi:hypothetical protein NKJ35_24350 [Mesorhizobium sp. M0136]|uniref:hypothetical protein n=1 Tax=Mesorhizobium sp. M0136 TaxID=2956890 RepID=UPI00333D9DF1